MDKYYLKADFQKDKQEVTKEEFIQAERAAGFRPKYGDGIATGGFSGNGVSGYIVRQSLPPTDLLRKG